MPVLDVRNQVVNERAEVATSQLDARLLADPRECGTPDSLDACIGRKHGELTELPHRNEIERSSLASADSGDEGEVVVRAPARLAVTEPVAHVAVVDWLGIRGDRRSDGLLQAPSHPAEIRLVARRGERLLPHVAEDERHLLGPDPLQQREQLRVEAELQKAVHLRC